MGVSGVATAKVLKGLGAEVTVVDEADTPSLRAIASSLRRTGVMTKLGTDAFVSLNSVDLIVVSPGVPTDSGVIRQAESSGIEVLSEIEIAASLTDIPMIAVTGTNGKTTVVTLIGEMLSAAHIDHAVAGNIGRPLIEVAASEKKAKVLVVEVSSFQLEHIKRFRPHIGIILNISEDHLDRHRNMEGYLALKMRLFENQTKRDFAVINKDDKRLVKAADNKNAQVIKYSRLQAVDQGVYIQDGMIKIKMPQSGEERVVGPVKDIRLQGSHNVENVLAAIAAASLYGLEPEPMMKAVRGFGGLKHRMEYITGIDGVEYYDDSKATNPDAALRAIQSFDRPIVLIAGGRNKNMDFSALAKGMAGKVKAAVLIGEASDEIGSAISAENKDINIYNALSMDQAVAKSQQVAGSGDIVILSPACASFDMFSGYEERGRVFAKAVNHIERKRKAAVND